MLDLRDARQRLIDSFPTVMVMQDSATPRETHVLLRGAYDRPGEKVEPGVPAACRRCRRRARTTGSGLAQWLVDPANPLTARVAVNRFWQMYFGAGLVKTVEDFGSQGEWPSHPELLDWLATEFVRTGWDMKALQKTIVMSATYRQSSKVTPELLQKDPENRLLARGPRVAASGGDDSRSGAGGVRPAGREDRRAFGEAVSAGRALEGAVRGEDYKPDHGRRSAPAQSLYVSGSAPRRRP